MESSLAFVRGESDESVDTMATDFGKFPKVLDPEAQWVNSVITHNHHDMKILEMYARKLKQIFATSGSPHLYGFDAVTNHRTISIDSYKQFLARFLPSILKVLFKNENG